MTTLRTTTPALRAGALRCIYTALLAALGLQSQAALGQVGRPDPDADRTEASLVFGAGSSDNIRRVAADGESGTYRLVGVQLDIVRAGPRLNANLGGDIEYRDYSTSGLASERFGVFDASLELFAVPERFSWLFAARGGQGRTDAFAVDSPENREDINIFETGPHVMFPLGQRTNIRLTATAGKRTFEVTESLDSDTADVEAGLYRAISPTTEFGVVVSGREIEYDPSLYDNRIERAYLVYSRELATGNASLAAGSNRAEAEGRSETGPYLSLDWQRQVGTRSLFTATLTNQFVDAGDNVDYERLVAYGTGDTQDGDILLSQDVYESTGLATALTIGGTRTRFIIGAEISESRYATDVALDNDELRVGLTTQRQLSSRMELGFTAALARREFQNGSQEDDDTQFEVWLQRTFSGPFSGRLGYRRNSRSGTDTLEYDENTVTLGFQYDIGSGDAD